MASRRYVLLIETPDHPEDTDYEVQVLFGNTGHAKPIAPAITGPLITAMNGAASAIAVHLSSDGE